MNMSFKSFWSSLKTSFCNDKLNFFLLSIAYTFIALSILSIPIFTYRDDYKIITNILCILASLSIIVYLIFRGKFYLNAFLLSFLLFLVYAIIITPLTTKEIGYDRLRSIITLYSFTICLIEFWFNKKATNFFLACISISVFLLVIAFFVIYRENILSLNLDERFGYDLGNVNALSFIFDIGALILLFVVLTKKKFYFFLLVPMLLEIFCSIITGSRWGFVSLIAGFVFLFYELFGKRYKIEFLICLTILVGAAIGILQLSVFEQYRKHFESLFTFITNPNSRGSSAVRVSMFIDGLRLWLKNIFFGYGVEGFYANTSYGMYSHSSIIELLTNFGIIGFFLFFYPIIGMLINFRKNSRDQLSNFSIGMFLFFIFYSFFATFHLMKIGIVCLGFFVGYDFYLYREKERVLSLSFINDNKFSPKFSYYVPSKEKGRTIAPKKIKIAFVISSLSGGGAERVASILSNNWASQNHSVTVFLTSKSKSNSYKIDDDIKIVNIADNLRLSFLPSRKIDQLTVKIAEYHPDIIVSFLNTPTYYASCSAKELRLPLVCSERNAPSKTKNPIYKFLRWISFKRASAIVFQGTGAQNYFSKPIRQKSTIINNPCEVFVTKRHKREKRIIAVGRLVKQKGFDILIKSFTSVLQNRKDYCLEIYGEGKEKKNLMKLIESNGLIKKVRIKEFSNNILDIIDSSSLYVLSSRYEGMPNVLCESLLLAVPCVSTDCPIGVPSQLIENRENGILCKVDDVDGMTNAINELISNYPHYSSGAIRKANYYKLIFNPENISKQWVDVFRFTIVNFKKYR